MNANFVKDYQLTEERAGVGIDLMRPTLIHYRLCNGNVQSYARRIWEKFTR